MAAWRSSILTSDASGPTGGTVTRYAVGGPLQEITIDPTGTRLFGLIDSAECGDALGCFGVIGFQLTASGGATARTQVPFPGAAPIPVPAGAAEGVARGIAAAPMDLALSVTPETNTAVDVIGLVMVSLASGSVALIDGQNMVPVNNNSSTDPYIQVSYHHDTTGTAVTFTAGDADLPSGFTGTAGATQTETVTITNGGALPSLTKRSGTLDLAAGTLTASALDFPALGVKVGDRVRFESGCDSGATAAVAAAAKGALTLTSIAACSASAAVTFDVTAPAPGADPSADVYVVVGEVSGLMGRVHPGETFTFDSPSFLGPSATATALSFTMGTGDPGDGASYALSLSSGFAAMEIILTTTTIVLTMPGAVAFDPQLRHFYVAYQGGGALVELDPTAVRVANNSLGIAVFR